MGTDAQETSRSYGVVVVEDSGSDACLIVEGLRQDGREVNIMLLTDGERASSLFGEIEEPSFVPMKKPDFIMLDLNLPKKGGDELITEIKAIPSLRSVPLVVFSGSDQAEDVWRCYELGATLVVPKPYEVLSFVSTVRAIQHYCLDVVCSSGAHF